MGVYKQTSEMSGGRAVYIHENGISGCWFHGGKKQWVIGDKKNVSTSTGSIYNTADKPSPSQVTTNWSKWTSSWNVDPEIKCQRIGFVTIPPVSPKNRTVVLMDRSSETAKAHRG
eukprot:TRINITY_DN6844_c0_g1_i1.p1 TRINITY_DN6844_c0_g1~~TRINITY_DN6844_c0_g1_i1.p1  ORF type:complete len:115 (+),score=26.32 TRINITY_DN6844_c0_g1_i1:173-517(+)